MPDVTLDDVEFGDAEVDAAFRRWRETIEASVRWSVHGNCQLESGPEGFTLYVGNRPHAKLAKTTAEGIPAMVGNVPGVGEIVMWTLDNPIVEGEPDIAYNVAPQAVGGNKIIVVNLVDGEWLTIFEICDAPA